MFSVNFRILAQLLTPTFMRQPVVLAWLYAALTPIISLYQRFVTTRDYDLLREDTNSTVPRLEYLLNYTFYPDGLTTEYDNRIKVVSQKSVEIAALYLGGVTHNTNEEKPLYLGEPQHLYTDEEVGVVGVDFSVIVPPAAQLYDVARMRSLLRTYALPDKIFIIFNQNQN